MKTILLSSYPISEYVIGSWNVTFARFIKKCGYVDLIICPEFNEKAVDGVEYLFIRKGWFQTVRKKINASGSILVARQVAEYLLKQDPLEKFILLIPDQWKVAIDLDAILRRKKMRNSVFMLFFLRGYSYNLSNEVANRFYSSCDEYIFLTYSSYQHEVLQYHSIPAECSVLYNAIDKELFHPVSLTYKMAIRKELGINDDQLVFLWISQDRPKKGLSIILRAFAELYQKYENIVLHIIGTQKEIVGPGIIWHPRRKNHELPAMYQSADFYLFSSLCHEGFPLTLGEALKCGCFALVSNITPLEEVIGFGKYAKLIDNPHVVESWIRGMEEAVGMYYKNEKINPYVSIPEQLYDLDDWCNKMCLLIDKWKKYM